MLQSYLSIQPKSTSQSWQTGKTLKPAEHS